jgi:catechol 2,3-dioxygenase-like lactoylglutathione lyase family enzyme
MAVKGLIYYALEVPDPTVGEAFYRDFGLRGAESLGNALQLEAGRGAGGPLLFAGPKKRLHHVAFAAPGDHFEAVRAALKQGGIPEIDPPQEAPQTGIWLHDPDGNLINIRSQEPTAIAAEPPLPYNGPGNATRVGTRGMPTFERAEPRRLGHVLFFTPDPAAAERFYTGVLGFKVSDRVPGLLSFLRCATDHHTLAFAKSGQRGFHHASYEVGSFDEVGMGGMWMRARGWEQGWGLGRHAIGSNAFYYIRDPWGSYAEYFCDMDYIPEDADWEPRAWDVKHAVYCWGPDMPRDFIENKE